MGKKRLYFAVILVAFYIGIMINYPNQYLKNLGCKQVLDLYAGVVSAHCPLEFLENPGLRKSDIILDKAKVGVVLPENKLGYDYQLDKLLDDKHQAIVECSDMDTWHTTLIGQEYLYKLQTRAYRVVVFDGGHHLPTLGMMPDIIILPELGGYAVHTYMVDGIKVDKVQALVRDAGIPAVLVRVPRLALMKNEKSLTLITGRILAASHYSSESVDNDNILVQDRMSKYNGMVFAYINKEYAQNIDLFIEKLNTLGIGDVKKINLAYNYANLSIVEADCFAQMVSKQTGITVENVNEPVKAANVFWGGK